MEKRIKFRLFPYYEETGAKDQFGNTVLREHTASFGQVVDIPREADIEKGERLGAFFSDEENQAITDGTYRGPSYDQLRTNAGLPLGEGGESTQQSEATDVSGMSTEEIADLIQNGNDGKGLNVNETIALAQGNKDLAEKVLDAETIATESEPRQGVLKALEKTMSEGNS